MEMSDEDKKFAEDHEFDNPEGTDDFDAAQLHTKTNSICYNHFDTDGLMSALTVGLLNHEYPINPENYINIESHEMQFAQSIPADFNPRNDVVYIVDLAYTERTYPELIKLYERVSHKLIWIDHHGSSIRLEKDHPELKEIPGIRSEKYCGALLTLLYFNLIDSSDSKSYLNNFTLYDIYMSNLVNKISDPHQDVTLMSLPVYLMVDKWDRWLNDPSLHCEEAYFNYGFNKCFEAVQMFKDNFTDAGLEEWANVLCDLNEPGIELTYDYIIECGRPICHQMISIYNEEIKNRYDEHINLRDLNHTPVDRNVSILCLNTQAHNSIILHDVKKDYDLICLFRFDGREWVYSLYQTGTVKSKEIDCAKLAECYGGGGHSGAAGWRLKSPMSFNNDEFFNDYTTDKYIAVKIGGNFCL